MTRSPPLPSLFSPRPDSHSFIGILDKAIPTPTHYRRGQDGALKYMISIDLNGYPSNQISVHNQNHIVTIRATRKENIHSKESSVALTREFHFPTNVIPSTMQWKIDPNGILTIEANSRENGLIPLSPRFLSPELQRRLNPKIIQSPIRQTFVRGPEVRSSHTLIQSPSNLTKLKSHFKSPGMVNYMGMDSPERKKIQVKFADTLQNVTSNSDNHRQSGLNGFVLTNPVPNNFNSNHQSNTTHFDLKNQSTNHSPAIQSPILRSKKPTPIDMPTTPWDRGSHFLDEYNLNSPKFFVQKIKLNSTIEPKNVLVTRQNNRVIIAAKHSEVYQDPKRPKSPVLSYQHYSEHTLPQGVDLNQLKVRLENGMIILRAPYVFRQSGLISPDGQYVLDIGSSGLKQIGQPIQKI